MQLICPVPDDFVLSRIVSNLILEDVVSPRRISVLVECYRGFSTTC